MSISRCTSNDDFSFILICDVGTCFSCRFLVSFNFRLAMPFIFRFRTLLLISTLKCTSNVGCLSCFNFRFVDLLSFSMFNCHSTLYFKMYFKCGIQHFLYKSTLTCPLNFDFENYFKFLLGKYFKLRFEHVL